MDTTTDCRFVSERDNVRGVVTRDVTSLGRFVLMSQSPIPSRPTLFPTVSARDWGGGVWEGVGV